MKILDVYDVIRQQYIEIHLVLIRLEDFIYGFLRSACDIARVFTLRNLIIKKG